MPFKGGGVHPIALWLSLKKQRIACHPYPKHPGEDWPEEEFPCHQTPLAQGQKAHLMLAERGTCLSNNNPPKEASNRFNLNRLSRRFNPYRNRDGLPMVSENVLKYMREYFNLDALVNCCAIPDTTRVGTPLYRQLDNQVRSKTSMLSRRHAKFSARCILGEINPEKRESFEKIKPLCKRRLCDERTN